MSMVIEHPATTTEETLDPPQPFIFRYLSTIGIMRLGAPPVGTDPTGGGETESQSSYDGIVKTDYADDSDTDDSGDPPRTGVLADSGTSDDD